MLNRPIAAAAAVLCCIAAHAGSVPGPCDAGATPSPRQKDLLIRFAAVVKAELQASGRPLAVVSRSGLDLARWGQRYSHAGLSLQASDNTPWSVRQLYYACDESRPMVFDQGLTAFVLGLEDPSRGYVSAVLIPGEPAERLARTTADRRRSLELLGASYSANAYPFSLAYQNCNQWVVEAIATAWGGLPGGDGARAEAQRWLWTQGYEPARFELGWRPWIWLARLVPWLHTDDHPADDLAANRLQVSMPSSIEAFVRAQVPEAQRIEFCLRKDRVVLRRGWDRPLDEDCTADEQDEVVVLGP